MTTTELREAAERLRAWYDHPLIERTHVYYQDVVQMTHDTHRLARAYLAEHPADSDQPLDEEFLLAAGYTRALNGPTRFYNDCLCVKPAFKTRAWAAWTAFQDSQRDQCLVVLLTRGDLRRLQSALGLPLTEER